MNNTIKTVTILMMFVLTNTISAQNPAIASTASNSQQSPFDVSVRNFNGSVYITWHLPPGSLNYYYVTNKSSDNINFKIISVKHFADVEPEHDNKSPIQFSIKDTATDTNRFYYRFEKANLKGEIYEFKIVPVEPATLIYLPII